MPAAPVILEREPPAALRGLVARLWYLRMPSPQPFELIVPIPAAHLIVNFSGPYRVIRRGGEVVDAELSGAFVSGIQTEYLVNENPAELHHVGAQFLPWALPAFGISAPDAAGRVIPAPSVFEASSFARGASALDQLVQVLTTRVDPGWDPDLRVVTAVEELLARPDTPIATLVERSELGSTRFVEIFREACGVTPKRFAEVCRHHRFLAELPVDGSLPTWTELIATHGYYDQPHFIREFRRFTGMSPSAYLEHRRRFGAGDPSFLAFDRV